MCQIRLGNIGFKKDKKIIHLGSYAIKQQKDVINYRYFHNIIKSTYLFKVNCLLFVSALWLCSFMPSFPLPVHKTKHALCFSRYISLLPVLASSHSPPEIQIFGGLKARQSSGCV